MNRPHQSKHAGRLRRLVDIGGGGNIGSHLIAHLARLREVGELLLIDSGTYEAKDIRSQEINPGDVGRFKALVQAQRASQINPGLRITAISERVEDVPWGLLNADVILTGLDSKASRCAVNLIAWRLGIPWIDAAVQADGLLARISVFRPGPNGSCLECAWDARDYATLEQRHLCQPDADAPAGSMNLRSKNAFDRKGREITAQVSLVANPYELTTARTPSPGDGHHRKIRPGYVFTYAESFQQRFGIQLSLSANELFNEQSGITNTIDNTSAARGPVINTLVFRDNPDIIARASFGLNLDYRITRNLVFSLRTSGSHYRGEINARTITFRANNTAPTRSSTSATRNCSASSAASGISASLSTSTTARPPSAGSPHCAIFKIPRRSPPTSGTIARRIFITCGVRAAPT